MGSNTLLWGTPQVINISVKPLIVTFGFLPTR